MVQHIDHGGSFLGGCKVGKRKTTENAVVEVVIKSIWKRKIHLGHQLHQLFLLDCERNILDYDRSRNQLVITILARRGLHLCTRERAWGQAG